MADESSPDAKKADQGEAVLSGAEVSAWQTVPAAPMPRQPQGEVLPPPPPAGSYAAPAANYLPAGNYLPPQSYSAPPPPPAAGAPSQNGYTDVFGGSVQPGPPPPPGYVPPAGYNPQGQTPPAGYVPPQGQYNSNMADLLAAGVLFGRGRRWQRRPARLIFWPLILAVLLGVGVLHSCMGLFH